MAGSYIAGHLVPVAWQPLGGVSSFLDIREHSLDLSVLLHDVTGYLAGGVRARIAGPLDAQGRVVCNMDIDPGRVPFLAPPLLIPGVRGIATFGVSPSQGIQVPLIMEKYHQGAGTDQSLMWDCDWKCDSRAGVIVYPALS